MVTRVRGPRLGPDELDEARAFLVDLCQFRLGEPPQRLDLETALPVDVPRRRDEAGDWVAVEIKRVGTIDAVEQLTRYLERIELEGCRGVLAAQVIKPQARTLAEARGIRCVEVDLAVLRGEREPELTLFAD